MKLIASQIWHIAKHDYAKRVRSYSFLITILVLFAWTLFIIPPPEAQYYILDIAGYRGVYNTVWIAGVITLVSTEYLTLFVFYTINNTIQNDIAKGMGAIIGTSSIKTQVYIAGKFFGNLLVLYSMIGVLMVLTPFIQIIRFEGYPVDLLQILPPFLTILLPTFTFVAAVALLFDALKILRGTLGNILYFIIGYSTIILLDIAGINILYNNIFIACSRFYDNCPLHKITGFNSTDIIQTFIWDRFTFTSNAIGMRVFVCGIALLLVFVVSKLFKRFDPTYERVFKKQSFDDDQLQKFPLVKEYPSFLEKVRINYLSLFLFEMKMSIKSLPKILIGIFFIGSITLLFTEYQVAKTIVLPLLWFFFIPLFSKTFVRDFASGMTKTIVPSLYGVTKLYFVRWFSIILIIETLSMPLIVRALIQADFLTIAAILSGGVFISSLALLLGLLSKSSKLFEVLYSVIWFLGPMFKQISYLDFLGTTQMNNLFISYLGVGIFCIIISFIYLQNKDYAFSTF